MAFTPHGAGFNQCRLCAVCPWLNLLTVKLFREIEFWFALIKILAIQG